MDLVDDASPSWSDSAPRVVSQISLQKSARENTIPSRRRSERDFRLVVLSGASASGSSNSRLLPRCLLVPFVFGFDSSSEAGADAGLLGWATSDGDGELVLCRLTACFVLGEMLEIRAIDPITVMATYASLSVRPLLGLRDPASS